MATPAPKVSSNNRNMLKIWWRWGGRGRIRRTLCISVKCWSQSFSISVSVTFTIALYQLDILEKEEIFGSKVVHILRWDVGASWTIVTPAFFHCVSHTPCFSLFFFSFVFFFSHRQRMCFLTCGNNIKSINGWIYWLMENTIQAIIRF